jgi:hypothetical protein
MIFTAMRAQPRTQPLPQSSTIPQAKHHFRIPLWHADEQSYFKVKKKQFQGWGACPQVFQW